MPIAAGWRDTDLTGLRRRAGALPLPVRRVTRTVRSEDWMRHPLIVAPSILAADFAKLGKKAGVTLNPGTPESTIEPVIDLVDLILVMSVNPGFGGQAFIPFAAEKIARLRALAGARPIDIEVDGGITAETAPLVARAGANVLVAGSAVFKGGKGDNYRANIAAIRNAAAFARGEAA